MNLVLGFLVKYVLSFVAVYFVALFFPLHGYMTLGHALVLGLVVAVLNFIVDLIVPRAVNSLVAVAIEFVIATLVVAFGNLWFWSMNVNWYFALFCGLLVALTEIYYHARFVRQEQM